MTCKALLSPLELFEREILPLHPEPADLFEKALWCNDLSHVFRELCLEFEERYSDCVHLICAENIQSDIYALETPITLVRTVNAAKLRDEMPEVFAKIVYLKSSDAEKILGRHMLYELAKEYAPLRVPPLETVNLGDMGKVLSEGEMKRFVKVLEKPGIPKVVRRDEV